MSVNIFQVNLLPFLKELVSSNFYPELIVVCFIALINIMRMYYFLARRRKASFIFIYKIGILVLLLAGFVQFFQLLSPFFISVWYFSSPLSFSNMMISDFYTDIVKLFLLFTALFSWLTLRQSFSVISLEHLLETFLFFFITLLSLSILISAYHLSVFNVAFVGVGLGIYGMLSSTVHIGQVYRDALGKYFILSALSTGFAFIAQVAAAHYFQTSYLQSIHRLIYDFNASFYPMIGFEVLLFMKGLFFSATFLIFALLFKISSFPCQLWAPEVYEGTITPVTLFLILPVKIAMISVLIRFCTAIFDCKGDIFFLGHSFTPFFGWHAIIFFAASGSLIWGCFGAFTEIHIKRFLAYSSMNQIGFLLFGLLNNTIQGIQTAFFFLIIYIISLLLFLVVYNSLQFRVSRGPLAAINLPCHFTYITDLKELTSSFNVNPTSVPTLQYNFPRLSITGEKILLTISLFSLSGLPPFAGFFSKFYILLHVFNSQFYELVFFLLISSLMSAFYYLNIVKLIWFEDFQSDADKSGQPNVPKRFLVAHLSDFEDESKHLLFGELEEWYVSELRAIKISLWLFAFIITFFIFFNHIFVKFSLYLALACVSLPLY